MCILISILVCPIWAGKDLHLLITRNMDKLAYSLDGKFLQKKKIILSVIYRKSYIFKTIMAGCVAEYFNNSGIPMEKLQGYKCVLNSKATEESMV